MVIEIRRGVGAACHAGLLATDAVLTCFYECDASLDPGLLVAFVKQVVPGEDDLVLARCRPQRNGAWPSRARAGHLMPARMVRERGVPQLRRAGKSTVAGAGRGTWSAVEGMHNVLAEVPSEAVA